MYVCWSNGQRSLSRGSFGSFTWLHAYLRDSLYKWHKYNPRCGNESRKISGSNGQTARSRRSFEIFLVSAAWLRVCLNDSFNMRHKYIYIIIWRCIVHRSRSKCSNVTQVVGSFCDVRLLVLCLLARFASYVAQIQPKTHRCVVHHFQVKVKGEGHTDRFCDIWPMAP